MYQIPQSALNVVTDLSQIGQPIAWAIVAFFLRDIYRDHRELRNDVHGRGGLNERVARIEGVQDANGHGS